MRGVFLLSFLVVGRGRTSLLPGPSGELGLVGGVGSGFLWSRAGAACVGQAAKVTRRLSRSSVTWGRSSLIIEYSGRLRT